MKDRSAHYYIIPASDKLFHGSLIGSLPFRLASPIPSKICLLGVCLLMCFAGNYSFIESLPELILKVKVKDDLAEVLGRFNKGADTSPPHKHHLNKQTNVLCKRLERAKPR